MPRDWHLSHSEFGTFSQSDLTCHQPPQFVADMPSTATICCAFVFHFRFLHKIKIRIQVRKCSWIWFKYVVKAPRRFIQWLCFWYCKDDCFFLCLSSAPRDHIFDVLKGAFKSIQQKRARGGAKGGGRAAIPHRKGQGGSNFPTPIARRFKLPTYKWNYKLRCELPTKLQIFSQLFEFENVYIIKKKCMHKKIAFSA